MKKEVDKYIHSGHRVRLFETASRSGFENLSDVQAVELLLCYIFPRGDVNPLAHRLLDRYKTFPGVLEAPYEDLLMVEGMGNIAARKLSMFMRIFDRFAIDKINQKDRKSKLGDIYDKIELLLRFKAEEEVHVFAINANETICGHRCLGKGSLATVGIDLRTVSLFMAVYKVPAAVLVHNHPNGECRPSLQDLESHKRLENLFKFAGCTLIDNLIIGYDGIYSMTSSSMRRSFFMMEDLSQLPIPDGVQQIDFQDFDQNESEYFDQQRYSDFVVEDDNDDNSDKNS